MQLRQHHACDYYKYLVAIALCNKDTQPSQTCSEGYTFSATALYRGVSLFLGGIN